MADLQTGRLVSQTSKAPGEFMALAESFGLHSANPPLHLLVVDSIFARCSAAWPWKQACGFWM
jgi:hypothetical protein